MGPIDNLLLAIRVITVIIARNLTIARIDCILQVGGFEKTTMATITQELTE